MTLRRVLAALASIVAAIVISGCLTSESHWFDRGDDKASNKGNNSANANSTTNNQTTSNGGTNNNNVLTDAGGNFDAGHATGCFAGRFVPETSTLSEASCAPTGDGFTCVCFDETEQTSTSGSCEQNLIDLCGATEDEVGHCGVDANDCQQNGDGFDCTCGTAAPVFSDADTCGEAIWQSCYVAESCGGALETCQADGLFTYSCSCDGLADRSVEAVRCTDALQVCAAPGATAEGCTGEGGSCARAEGGYRCDCDDGSVVDVSNSEAGSQSCSDILAGTCGS